MLAANAFSLSSLARRVPSSVHHPDGSAGLGPIVQSLVANTAPLLLGVSFLALSLVHPGLFADYKKAVIEALPFAIGVTLLISVPPLLRVRTRIANANRTIEEELANLQLQRS